MELAERLRKIMQDEFGIRDNADLLAAIEEHEPVDLGIFVTPLEGEKNAKSA